MDINILIDVPPYPYQRPRFSIGKKVYNSSKYSAYKRTVQWIMRSSYKGAPLMGPLKVHAFFEVKAPQNKRIYPSVRPDLDNLIKAILDCGNSILWADDAQIVDINATKRYGPSQTSLVVSNITI